MNRGIVRRVLILDEPSASHKTSSLAWWGRGFDPPEITLFVVRKQATLVGSFSVLESIKQASLFLQKQFWRDSNSSVDLQT